MKALNVRAPSALLTPYLIDRTSSAAQQATEVAGAVPRLRPAAARSGGLMQRGGGAGCATGGLGATRSEGRGRRCRGAGRACRGGRGADAGRGCTKTGQNSPSAFWTQYATQYADLLHEQKRSPLPLFYILFIFNSL